MRGGGLDSLQPPFSLLDREAERETLPWCTGHGVGVLTYGSLGGGLLGGRYTASRRPSDKRARFYRFFKEPRYSAALALVEVLNAMAREHDAATAQIAIAWTLSRPGVTCALVGARGAGRSECRER